MKRIFIALLFLPLAIKAQNINLARQIIDTLASPYLAGRAYCTGGDKLAAKYIIDFFKRIYVKPFGKSYSQQFTIEKNCILDSVYLFIDKKLLKLGQDYIIKGNTPSITGNYRLLYVKNPKKWRKFARTRLDSVFIVVNYNDIQKIKKKKKQILAAYEQNRMQAAGIIILKEKFYYVPRSKQASFPLIYLNPSAFNPSAQTVSIKVHSQVKTFKTQNIIGYLPGRSDSIILFTAHYDHLGQFGQIYFPGANDNASGVAMVLSIAKHFANRKTPPKYTLVFILFSGEEMGLVGSIYFVTHPVFDLSRVKLAINLDMVGSGDEGITIVNGKELAQVVQTLRQINIQFDTLVPEIKVRPNAPNSDHYPFTQVGVPAIFIYTRGAYKEYHNIYDRPEKLPLNRFENLNRLLVNFVEKY